MKPDCTRRSAFTPIHGRVVNPVVTLLILAGLSALMSPLSSQTTLSTDGVIESRSGGFRFPDGTLQTTAGGDSCTNPNDPADKMIRVGSTCIDKYEASVWSSPTGGTQYGVTGDDYPCSDNSQDCAGEIYARSVPGVKPSRFITWFQAQAALANSGKRLPTNAEWQMAVAGTPDDTSCNVDTGSLADTGAHLGCFSDREAFDMVGNLWEWTGDWGDNATTCTIWSATYGDDFSCVGLGDGETNSLLPGVLIRGGWYENGTSAGPFAITNFNKPSASRDRIGFRGAR